MTALYRATTDRQSAGGRTPPLWTQLKGWTAVVLVASVALAAVGLPMSVCLLLVTLAPMVTVVGFELIGHRHAAEAVSRSLNDDA